MSSKTRNSLLVDVQGLHKAFGTHTVLNGINLQIHEGEVLCVIGPSGSGKSTLLRSIAFLDPYNSGDVFFEGRLVGYRTTGGVRRLSTERELNNDRAGFGMVFQHFYLWPHMNALANVTEALRVVKKMPRAEADAVGTEMLAKVGLSAHAAKYPEQLSGDRSSATPSPGRSRSDSGQCRSTN